jgi:hypothetical protein
MLLLVAYAYQFHSDLYLLWESHSPTFDKLVDWARGEDFDNLPVFAQLKRPYFISTSPQAPVPDYKLEYAGPEPTDPRVFWMQPIVHELQSEGVLASHIHGYVCRVV